jgi:hypothetical protein
MALQAELEAARAAPLFARTKSKIGKDDDCEQAFAAPMLPTRKGTLTSDETQAKKKLKSRCLRRSVDVLCSGADV